jgi:hypothetical protein
MFDKICYYVEEIIGGIMFVVVFVGLFTWVPAMMKATILAQ